MADKQPTIDTCVLSGKPIRQKHLDDKLVIPYGKGRAFIKSVQDTIQEPPVNPVVYDAKSLASVSMPYHLFNFPRRYKMRGRIFKSLPVYIYIQNQMFMLHSTSLINKMDKEFEVTKDGLVESGIAIYKKTSTQLDKTEDN